VYLLGAATGVAEQVAERYNKLHPKLKIVGTAAGSPSVRAEKALCAKIAASKAAVLLVAYGSPAQEKWIARNLPKLPRVRLAIGVGGAFDFHAGRVARAPVLLRRLGLEWLYRLLRQPWRLPRIWNATGRFVGLVYRQRRK
jgi:N-acetylglucosaminyldiphosphoundecaprenol N-acetyl-beta-D-mannosaminyltransferase